MLRLYRSHDSHICLLAYLAFHDLNACRLGELLKDLEEERTEREEAAGGWCCDPWRFWSVLIHVEDLEFIYCCSVLSRRLSDSNL